jgi:hypothetical protein
MRLKKRHKNCIEAIYNYNRGHYLGQEWFNENTACKKLHPVGMKARATKRAMHFMHRPVAVLEPLVLNGY